MYRTLQPAAEHLVQGHWLAQDDDLGAVVSSLKLLMKEGNLEDNGIRTGRVRCGDALMGAGGRKPPRQTRLRLDCVERSGVILRDWEDACMMFLGEDYMAVSHLVEG
jgi:hypothetical protein